MPMVVGSSFIKITDQGERYLGCELFELLENTIRDQLISTLAGQEVSDADRQIS